MAKYKVRRNGCDISEPAYRFYGLWKGIVSIIAHFATQIQNRIGSDEKILF